MGEYRLTLSGMSVGPLFPVDRTGRLVRTDYEGSRVRASDRERLEKPRHCCTASKRRRTPVGIVRGIFFVFLGGKEGARDLVVASGPENQV